MSNQNRKKVGECETDAEHQEDQCVEQARLIARAPARCLASEENP